jgi:hypothetical protein
MAHAKICPHCRWPLPPRLVWKTLFSGQVPHACPACGKKFRLTYPSKIRVSFLNVALILGFLVLWNLPDIPRNLAVYAALGAVILWLLPRLARYEKTSAPYR